MQCKDILFSIVKLDPLIDPYWTFGDVYPAYVAYGKVMFSVLLTGGGDSMGSQAPAPRPIQTCSLGDPHWDLLASGRLAFL